MFRAIFIFYCVLLSHLVFAQGNPPWERPLKIATSIDGQIFSPSTIFQDSSGVPSMIKWKGDTIVCVFQWFRQPINSPTWDRVAVKFSYDNGLSWNQPSPIVVNGLPSGYQRPFDPTLAVMNQDSLRIFFSSSDGLPMVGQDSIIDTYSAVSTDGSNYIFENGARYDNPSKKVIDPGAIIFNGLWHYEAPIGAPQDGAYHCTSTDGVNFIRQTDYLSDAQHNWTGNFMLFDTSELRFYGSGQQIWYNSSSDGFSWNGFTSTNVMGGDPSTIKLQSNNFIMVFVGESYPTSINDNNKNTIKIYPNPVTTHLKLDLTDEYGNSYKIYSSTGKLTVNGKLENKIDVSNLENGSYILIIENNQKIKQFHFFKQ